MVGRLRELNAHAIGHVDHDVGSTLLGRGIGGRRVKVETVVKHAFARLELDGCTDRDRFMAHRLPRRLGQRIRILSLLPGLELGGVSLQAEAGITMARRHHVHAAIHRRNVIERQPTTHQARLAQRPQVEVLVKLEVPVVSRRLGDDLIVPQPHPGECRAEA